MPDSPYPQARPEHSPWYRCVPSCYPPRQLWDDYASADEFEAAALIEGFTSDRLRAEQTALSSIPLNERMFGDGASPVMAAFCYPNPDGSRFSPGNYGVYYAAESVHTAATEVGYHRRRFWLDNPTLARRQHFRIYRTEVAQALINIRSEATGGPLHDPESWVLSQAFGQNAFESGSWGIHYRSVRRAGSECIALLRPLASTPAVQTSHLLMEFDGERVSVSPARG